MSNETKEFASRKVLQLVFVQCAEYHVFQVPLNIFKKKIIHRLILI